MKSTICVIFILCIHSLLHCQISVQFMPVNAYFFSADQMWNFQLLNSSKKTLTGKLEISLFRNSSALIKSITVNNVSFERGINVFSGAEKNMAIEHFGNDEISNAFRNTNILSPGMYSWCISVKNELQQTVVYSCNEINITSFSLPVLQYPNNGAIINTTMPVLTWLPVMPGTIYNINYHLHVWESGKGPALKIGGDLVNIVVPTTNFQYNDLFPELTIGKNYYWNIEAYSGDYYLGTTETWTFALGSSPLAKEADVEEESYRNIGDQTTNAEYVANNQLKIAYINSANDSLLNYQIFHNDSLLFAIEELPQVLLRNGRNLVTLDLLSTGKFTSEEYYTMQIDDANGKQYVFNFKYVEL